MRADEINEEMMPDLEQEALFEMANLVPEQTGVDGIIYISTRQASHGPRVKYSLRPGRNQPSFSVSISENPQIVVSSLPDKAMNAVEADIFEWVQRNHEALLNFWNNGTEWTDPQVTAFKAALQRL